MTKTTSKVITESTSPEERALREALEQYVPDTERERMLVRKIDRFLGPILWVMYILNYVDRTNIV